MPPLQPPVEKLGSGLWSLPVPIPNNPLGYTLVYLLDSDRGPVLVDAGWHDPATLQALTDGVAQAGFDLSDIHGVLVTHHHPDHYGLAGEVRKVSGAWVALHAEDARMVANHRGFLLADDESAWQDHLADALHEAGAPGDEIEALLSAQQSMSSHPPVEPDRAIADDELMDVPGRRVRSVWTPGHSPGHTCFVLEEEDRLLAGDHLLPDITPHVGLYDDGPERDPLGDYLASLGRIEALAPMEVLPAHLHRFGDVAARVAAVRAHHEARLAEVREALDTHRGATLWELAMAMTWNRPWEQIPTMMRRVASSEAAAHLRLLEHRGEAVRVPGSSPPRYEPAGP